MPASSAPRLLSDGGVARLPLLQLFCRTVAPIAGKEGQFAAISGDGDILVVDLKRMLLVDVLQGKGLSSVVSLRDSQLLLGFANGAVETTVAGALRDRHQVLVATGAPVVHLTSASDVTVACDPRGTVRLLEPGDRRRPVIRKLQGATSWSSFADRVVGAGPDGLVVLLDPLSGETLSSRTGTRGQPRIASNAAGILLVRPEETVLLNWSLERIAPRSRRGWVACAAFDRSRFVVSSWNAAQELAEIILLDDEMNHLATCGATSTLPIVELATNSGIVVGVSRTAQCICWSPYSLG